LADGIVDACGVALVFVTWEYACLSPRIKVGFFIIGLGSGGEGGFIDIGLSVVIFLLVFAMGYCLLDWFVCRSVACATSCISRVWVVS
jgi:hypothetical protein